MFGLDMLFWKLPKSIPANKIDSVCRAEEVSLVFGSSCLWLLEKLSKIDYGLVVRDEPGNRLQRATTLCCPELVLLGSRLPVPWLLSLDSPSL